MLGSIAGRARELGRRVEERRGGDEQLAQQAIVAARRGDAEELARLTHPDFRLELRTGAGDLVAEGEPAREQLLALAATIFRRGAVSEGWGGFSTGGMSASSLAIVYGDGRRTDLAFTALARNGLLERLHVLAAGEPGGRRPAPIELTSGGGAEEEGEGGR